mmetsp:Transcript_86025/g.139493  ORF Transcript_86025/g.139493 Transcript_86025/m.139493 type:complete len:227 (-) Transcript_86025:191-871(-)
MFALLRNVRVECAALHCLGTLHSISQLNFLSFAASPRIEIFKEVALALVFAGGRPNVGMKCIEHSGVVVLGSTLCKFLLRFACCCTLLFLLLFRAHLLAFFVEALEDILIASANFGHGTRARVDHLSRHIGHAPRLSLLHLLVITAACFDLLLPSLCRIIETLKDTRLLRQNAVEGFLLLCRAVWAVRLHFNILWVLQQSSGTGSRLRPPCMLPWIIIEADSFTHV